MGMATTARQSSSARQIAHSGLYPIRARPRSAYHPFLIHLADLWRRTAAAIDDL